MIFFFFFQAEDGIRDRNVTGVQTCALPIFSASLWGSETRLDRVACLPIECDQIGGLVGRDTRCREAEQFARANRSHEIGRASCRGRVEGWGGEGGGEEWEYGVGVKRSDGTW